MTTTLFESIPEPRLAQDVLGSGTAVLNGFALEGRSRACLCSQGNCRARTLPPNGYT